MGGGVLPESVGSWGLLRSQAEIEVILADKAMSKMTDAQTVFAAGRVLRRPVLLLRLRGEIGKVRDFVQQGTLLAETEQESQCERE